MNSQEVKVLRENLGLTQSEFADKLGTSRNTVARIEAGKQEVPITKKVILEELLKSLNNSSSSIFLEKNGVRFELTELVSHFIQNHEEYYKKSEYLRLWIKEKSEELSEKRLKHLIKDLKAVLKTDED